MSPRLLFATPRSAAADDEDELDELAEGDVEEELELAEDVPPDEPQPASAATARRAAAVVAARGRKVSMLLRRDDAAPSSPGVERPGRLCRPLPREPRAGRIR